MSELPADLLGKIQARRKELAIQEQNIDNVGAGRRPEEEEYNERLKRAVGWAKILGPLAVAKQVQYDAVVFSGNKDFPVWYVAREPNDGNPNDRVDLSRNPTYTDISDVWSGVIMDRKGLLFYFGKTADMRRISIDNIGVINHETIPYRGLEGINDVYGHGQGIEGIEKSLADFAINNDLVIK